MPRFRQILLQRNSVDSGLQEDLEHPANVVLPYYFVGRHTEEIFLQAGYPISHILTSR
uniref:Uncharacterized protein n=1 Tax=Arundo donax TaxID=35708 RepID=A0A0A9D9J1_ARUDO